MRRSHGGLIFKVEVALSFFLYEISSNNKLHTPHPRYLTRPYDQSIIMQYIPRIVHWQFVVSIKFTNVTLAHFND